MVKPNSRGKRRSTKVKNVTAALVTESHRSDVSTKDKNSEPDVPDWDEWDKLENHTGTAIALPGTHVVCAPISPSKVPPAPDSESHRARIAREALATEGFKVVGKTVKLSPNSPTSFIRVDLSQSDPTPRTDGLDHTELTIKRRLRQCLRAVRVEVDDDLMFFGDQLIIPLPDERSGSHHGGSDCKLIEGLASSEISLIVHAEESQSTTSGQSLIVSHPTPTQSTDPTPAKKPDLAFVHSGDYRSIVFNGKEYATTPRQALIIGLLDGARKKGVPSLSDKSILKTIRAEISPLNDYLDDC